jgi:hypothetical protein
MQNQKGSRLIDLLTSGSDSLLYFYKLKLNPFLTGNDINIQRELSTGKLENNTTTGPFTYVRVHISTVPGIIQNSQNVESFAFLVHTQAPYSNSKPAFCGLESLPSSFILLMESPDENFKTGHVKPNQPEIAQ